MSDLEYSEKKNSPFKFIPPPSTHEELLKTASETDTRYKLTKRFLDGKMSESYYQNTSEEVTQQMDMSNKIPPNFHISTLVYPQTRSEVILCGVEKRSYIHAHMLSDILLQVNPSVIFTQISPDEPYFVRKPKNFGRILKYLNSLNNEQLQSDNSGYKGYWKAFIKGQGSGEFYVNPGPHYLSDTIIFKNKNSNIIEENLVPCTKEFDIGANIAYSRAIELSEGEILPD